MTALEGAVVALPRNRPWAWVWAVAVAAMVALWLAGDAVPWALHYPRPWVVPLRFWISDFMKWLVNEASLGLFTFKEFTRSIAWLLSWPLDTASGLLANGFAVPLGDGTRDVLRLPRFSWLAVVAVVALMGHAARGWRLAFLTGGCFLYLAVFGQWGSAMVTLASIAIAVPFGVVGGLLLGVLGARSRRSEAVLTPFLDLMQTVPIFAYLVPVLFLFGFGPVAAMTATIVYAMPPMVRCTMLALKGVPTEVVEFGRMAGCSRRQLTWKVMIPAARSTLMVGVNQVIMLSLNMVIIASMIGAGGMDFDVLTSLKRLDIGKGLEAGIAITLLAVALDRLSQAYAGRPPPVHRSDGAGFVVRHPHLVIGGALILGLTLLGAVVPAVQTYPAGLELTTSGFWDDLVTYIIRHYFDFLDAIKSWLLLNMLIPFKRFLVGLPWLGVVGLVALAGLQLGGRRLALVTGGLALFIAVTGNWEKAMISTYLVGISALFATVIGMPVGVAAARNERLHRIVQGVIDTLQTLPSFVYLIPVVMLFRVGDFSAMIAVVAYSVVPAIRYTDHGIRQVPPSIIEAAAAAGCSRRQTLWKVQLPLALPEIMLGVNQTIMMALSMLVITALVGTRDLGQEVYIALTKADTGRGLVAGACVASLAMISDRLISAWSKRKKRELGLA